jgi:hypothetical protein
LIVLFFVLCWRISIYTKFGATNGRGFAELGATDCRGFMGFVIGAILISLAGVCINMLVFYDRDLAAGLLRYYWFRLADVAVPLGAALLGCKWLVRCRASGAVIGGIAAVLAGLATIGHFGALAAERMQPSQARAEHMHNVPDWVEACNWAADEKNTLPSARFITPLWSSTFKWHARRPEVATWKDVPQDAQDIVQWQARIQDLFTARDSSGVLRWLTSSNELGAERIEELGKKYQADYLISDTIEPPLKLKVVYRNESYTIYQLPTSQHQ